MPRPVYDQSPDNPVQFRHLPQQPTEVEFAYQSAVDNDDVAFTNRVFVKLFLTSGIGLAAYWIDIWAMAWFPLNLVIMGVIAWNIPRLFASDKKAHAVLTVPLLLAAWLYHLLPLPLRVEVAIAAIATALVAREVARHYVFVATASPMSRQMAWSLRDIADWWTLLTASLLLPIALGICLPPLFLPCLCTSLVLAALTILFSWKQIPDIGGRYLDAIRSYCSYNRHDVPAPGLLDSPSGTCPRRLCQLAIVVLLLSLLLARLTFATSLLTAQISPAGSFIASAGPGPLIFQVVTSVAAIVLWFAAPILVLSAAILITALPVLARFTLPTSRVVSPEQWQSITSQVRHSSNKIESESIYLGRLAHDHSPLLVPRIVFQEHAHFLGDSGSGKTARGLTPLAEQLIADGKSSLMVIDLKGDSGEMFASLRAAAVAARNDAGRKIPIRYFNTREDASTFAFNPFQLTCWSRLNLFQQTDILCGALGLVYGTEYGEGYFSSANASILYATLKHFPEVGTFGELADRISYVVSRPKAHGIDEQTKNAGNHVRMAMVRLASFAALNVSPQNSPSESVVTESIDPSRLFQQPEVHYYHLSATLGPGSSPEIGRLAVYMLLVSATLSRRNLPVYLIIDEFQRMASHNLDYMLQLARGMGVGVILANQSVQDLKQADLVSVLETNCRYRQWFAVSGWDDQERICKASGETIDTLNSVSVSRSNTDRGTVRNVSRSSQQFIAPRLTRNDIKLISDDDRQSIALINRGAGYSQYGGMPIVVESDFHVSKAEFERRKNASWPQGERGTFVPNQWRPPATITPRKGRKQKPIPIVTQETISDPTTSSATNLFDRYLADHPIPSNGGEQ